MERPPDLVQLLAAARPSSKPRYWNRIAVEQTGTMDQLIEFRKALHEDTSVFGGFKTFHFNIFACNGRQTESSPTYSWPDTAAEQAPILVYPHAHIPNGLRTVAKDKEKGLPLYFDVDLRPEMRGFLSCLETSGFEMERLYPDPDAQRIEWRANWRADRRPATAAREFAQPLEPFVATELLPESSRYPIVALATKAQSDVLAPWRQQAVARFGIVTGLTLSIAQIGFFPVRYLSKGSAWRPIWSPRRAVSA